MKPKTPEYWRSVMNNNRKRAIAAGRLATEAINCGHSLLACDHAIHAARRARVVITAANELYGESGWTVDELEKYFKLSAKFT